MFHIHILTYSERILNIDKKNFSVLTSETESTYYTEGLKFQKRMYQLKIGVGIDVYSPEISLKDSANGEKHLKYLILPEFVIPGRPYPIYIYLYAIMTYCLNKLIGQREAAKRTQEHFGLKTFSHTTLGRAMKKLEEKIKKQYEEPQTQEEPKEKPEPTAKKFPSTKQTRARRNRVASYLINAAPEDRSYAQEVGPSYKQPSNNEKRQPYKGIFVDACHYIARYVFLNYRCLLL